MREQAFETAANSYIAKGTLVEQPKIAEVDKHSLPQHDPLLPALPRAIGERMAATHAVLLQQTMAASPSRATRSVLQMQRLYGNHYIQRVLALRRNDGDQGAVDPAVEQTIHHERGGGQALDSGVRRQMEPAFGADFSGIRVHTGAKADTLNRALNARAFTTGRDLFFRQGAYDPGSASGRELLAHELTHVVQQQGGTVQRKLTLGQPNDKYEQEADQVARTIIQREQQTVQPAAQQHPGALQRQTQEEEKDKVQAKPVNSQLQRAAADDEEKVQSKAEAASLQRQSQDEEEKAQTKAEPGLLQRQTEDEEKQPVQTKLAANSLQRASGDEEKPVQTKADAPAVQRQSQDEEDSAQAKPAENSLQRQTEEEEKKPIQTKRADSALQRAVDQAAQPPLQMKIDQPWSQPRLANGNPTSSLAVMAPPLPPAGLRPGAITKPALPALAPVGNQAPTSSMPVAFVAPPKSIARPSQPAVAEPARSATPTKAPPAINGTGPSTGATAPTQEAPAAKATAATPEAVASGAEPPPAEPPLESESSVTPPAAGAPTIAVNGATKAEPQAGSPVLDETAPQAGPDSDTATAKAPAAATEDPGFQEVVAKVKRGAAREQVHAPASVKAQEAQAAAQSPTSELAGKAQSNQIGEMATAETPGFDANAFKAKLMARIRELAPKDAAAVDEFKEQNKAGQLRGDLQAEIATQKVQSQAPLAAATEKAPDTGSVEPKPTTPLQPNQPGTAPGEIDAGGAAPKPKRPAEVEAPLRQQSQRLDQQMAGANVTKEQLVQSNEPEFQAAAAAKDAAQAHAQNAPPAYRQDEQGIVAQAQAGALATAQTDMAAMHSERTTVLVQVNSAQKQGKSADEQARAEVGAHIQSLYDATRSKVEGILASLDTEVDQLFSAGAEAAKQTFETHVDTKMKAYKEDRYGGSLGWAQWLLDKVQPIQPDVLAIFERGQQEYLTAMDGVVNQVVALIGGKLAEAKTAIASGKEEIQQYVATLAPNLQQVGQEAAQAIQSQFDELEQGVDAKQGELIDKLATQYNKHLQAVDDRLAQLKAENQTLYDQATDKVGGVIKTILGLKNMLTDLFARAARAVEKIIANPIGFLGNLVSGVKQGLMNFVGNIGAHLQEGLIGWLTGAITNAGIVLPQNWDLPGIFQFAMQVMGLSFESLLGKVSQLFGIDIMRIIAPVKQVIDIYQAEGLPGLIKAGLARLIGEERMKALLQVWEIIQTFISGNWHKLWAMLQEHLSNLQEMVFGKIQEFLTERVIKAGIIWIVSLLNPASAVVKACKAIYDIVMFFVERGSQIMALVNAVIDSVGAVASGDIAVAASAIENALAKGIPLAIGFLSSLLGLGNVSEKVQEIIQSVRGLVDKGINAIFNLPPVKMVVGFIKQVIGKIKEKFTGNKPKEQTSNLPVSKNEVQDDDPQTRIDKASAAIQKLLKSKIPTEDLPERFNQVKSQFHLRNIEITESSGVLTVTPQINPEKTIFGYLVYSQKLESARAEVISIESEPQLSPVTQRIIKKAVQIYKQAVKEVSKSETLPSPIGTKAGALAEERLKEWAIGEGIAGVSVGADFPSMGGVPLGEAFGKHSSDARYARGKVIIDFKRSSKAKREKQWTAFILFMIDSGYQVVFVYGKK